VGRRFNIITERHGERVLEQYDSGGRYVQTVHWQIDEDEPVVAVEETVSPVIPELVSATVENDSKYTCLLIFSLPLKTFPSPNQSVFTIKVNGNPRTEDDFDGLDLSGVNVQFITPFSNGDIITVSYTAPLENPLQGVDGGKVASFIDYPVMNNIAEPQNRVLKEDGGRILTQVSNKIILEN
jgi:hypothetical protein